MVGELLTAASRDISQVMYIDGHALRLSRWRAGGSAQVHLQPRPQQVRYPPELMVVLHRELFLHSHVCSKA